MTVLAYLSPEGGSTGSVLASGVHRADFAAVSCVTVWLIGLRYTLISKDYSFESLSIRNFRDKIGEFGFIARVAQLDRATAS